MIRQYKSADLEAVKRLHFEGLKQFNAYIGNPNLDKDMETYGVNLVSFVLS
jgi:hypothetical protein